MSYPCSGILSSQLEAGFDKYLERVHGMDGTALSSTDLTSLGEFLCGASVTVIESIPTASYE